jgi:hypothetical protein
MNNNEKLSLLKYLIFMRGKLQHLSFELLIAGRDTSKVDAREEKLAKQIDVIRSRVMESWQGNASQIMGELRSLNNKAQEKIRQMRASVDKTKKLTEFVSILDQGLALVGKLIV